MPKSLYFERTMQLFFGDEAHQIAGCANNPKYRKIWLLKLINQILKMIDQLDTTLEHKQILMTDLEILQGYIENDDDPTWEIIYRLFTLCGHLLGHDRIYQKPARIYSLSYHQNNDQYFTQHMLHGDSYQLLKDEKDAITLRTRLANQLKNEGFSTFKIALTLNISEYQIKKLIKLAKTNIIDK